jgi:hypothetical protein
MPRIPQPTDFVVKVDDVGTFTFAKRTMRDEVAIQVEYARMIDGVTPTEWLAAICGWLSALRVLTVRAPEGWDLDDMDPLDPSTYAKLARVHGALSEKEQSFRRGPGANLQGAGAGNVPDAGVPVSAQVQPAADGPSVP